MLIFITYYTLILKSCIFLSMTPSLSPVFYLKILIFALSNGVLVCKLAVKPRKSTEERRVIKLDMGGQDVLDF